MCLIISMNFLFVMICLVCHDRQSGFRSKHSCETAFHLLVDEWLPYITRKLQVYCSSTFARLLILKKKKNCITLVRIL